MRLSKFGVMNTRLDTPTNSQAASGLSTLDHSIAGFYTRQKSIMQRWPESIQKGAEFTMPVSK